MEKIRLGLIGCGGRAGSHMHSFEQMADVEVVAVADPVAVWLPADVSGSPGAVCP